MSNIAFSEIDFWLDSERYDDYIVDNPLDISKKEVAFSIDLIRLASIRSAISNFIRILTRKSIPVYFNDSNINRNYMGKVIYLSASINSKLDFDVAVGLALHEGAHTLLTDYDLVMGMWANLPSNILQIAGAKGIRLLTIEKFIRDIWNIVEDRYIDDFVFKTTPGYRGYYVALYDRYFNDIRIDELLEGEMYRWPSLDSYLFRICNITNIHTDLTALPRLDEIADVLDISNLSRLNNTKKRIEVAFKITEIVLDCVDKVPPSYNKSKSVQQLISPDEFFGSNSTENDDEESNDKDGTGNKEIDDNIDTKIIDEIADIISGKDKSPITLKENSSAVSKITENESEELKDLHEEIYTKQRRFLMGQIVKDKITSEQKDLLDLIEQHGIILVRVGENLISDNKNFRINCILVKKLTKELILKGTDIFPLSGVKCIGNEVPLPPESTADAVRKGILLGTKLGKKLQLRTEINLIKSLRKKSGRINKRQLHEAAFDAEDLFYNIHIESHNKATLHISVDASSSMEGNKWIKTMTAVVAICKATSMINNVHVTVSFRTTQCDNRNTLPYVVLAYDSKIDKFSKVKSLFPYLSPNGLTPEGLAFEAIMDLFKGITPDEEDRYFLNLSDGEPCYQITSSDNIKISYMGDVGVYHTKTQINKIRNKGVYILSYFITDIEDGYGGHNLLNPQVQYTNQLKENFQKMYGKNAKFVNVENVTDLAKTMNGLFLAKDNV